MSPSDINFHARKKTIRKKQSMVSDATSDAYILDGNPWHGRALRILVDQTFTRLICLSGFIGKVRRPSFDAYEGILTCPDLLENIIDMSDNLIKGSRKTPHNTYKEYKSKKS